MEKLAFSFLIMCLYAILISTGIGRRMDDDLVTRWIVVVGGVLIVLVPNAWGDWDSLRGWLIAFGLNSFPLIGRAAYLYHADRRVAEIRRFGIPLGTLDHANPQTMAGSCRGSAYGRDLP